MREYELTVIYDLAVAEAGGPEASLQLLTTAVEARGGKVLRTDHWGRRRMAYPINRAIDGDYIISRVEIEPAEVTPLEAALKIDERVYRFLVVRADELPVPPPPREPRRPAPSAEAPAETPAAVAAPAAEAPATEAAPSVAESPATPAEASALGEAGASPEPVPADGAPEPESAPASGTTAETDANA